MAGDAQVPAHHLDELSGSRLAAQTAAKWPIAQMTRPTSQSRRPRPTAPASVPFDGDRARGAPPSRIVLGQRAVDRHRRSPRTSSG
jgi:hypothetical protein